MTCEIDPRPLQPPLRTPEFEALYHLLKLATVCQELEPLYLFLVDSVPASALYWLAEQFGVLGFKGWALADTEAKQRELVKMAIKLNRQAGTPGAIINALAAVGITVKQILENPVLNYSGQWTYGGGEAYAGKRLDRFIVIFDPEPDPSLTDLIDALIDTWKNVRSNRLLPVDLLLYDGTWDHSGTQDYDGYFNS